MATPLIPEEVNAINAINAFRASNGVGPLQASTGLRQAAIWLANDMATKNYLAHTDSLGRNPFDRMDTLGYKYSTARGENIAAGYPSGQRTFEQWRDMCDPDASGVCDYTHRKIMNDPNFKVIGIARAYNPNSTYKYYWAADFGGYVDTTEPLSAPSQPAPMIAQPMPQPQPMPMPQPMPRPLPMIAQPVLQPTLQPQPVRTRGRPTYNAPISTQQAAPVTTIPQAFVQPIQSSRVSQQARPIVPGALTLPTAIQVRPRVRAPVEQLVDPIDNPDGLEILTDGLIPIQRLDERGGTGGSSSFKWLFVIALLIIVILLIFWISRNKITVR